MHRAPCCGFDKADKLHIPKSRSTYIDSYPEFLRLEKFLKLILRILKFSFFPQKIFSGSRKFFFHIYHLHFALSLIASSLYFEKNLAIWVLTIAEFITVLQIVVKFSSIITHEKDLNQFFLWIRQIHQLDQNESIANSTEKHFRNNIFLLQRILKYIFIFHCVNRVYLIIFLPNF